MDRFGKTTEAGQPQQYRQMVVDRQSLRCRVFPRLWLEFTASFLTYIIY
jgi:hypothetical protein